MRMLQTCPEWFVVTHQELRSIVYGRYFCFSTQRKARVNFFDTICVHHALVANREDGAVALVCRISKWCVCHRLMLLSRLPARPRSGSRSGGGQTFGSVRLEKCTSRDVICS